ncbi:hypothetical protein DFH09DRAFT_1088963 [Mycena vulgaris]|nr:hypothetical protein DFH09DRAFT_1088961 [Mycena vulgaris]KAJ6543266.1 hypothetical protein DFH09DRAFT_1088963 [Mycena vulgaris]
METTRSSGRAHSWQLVPLARRLESGPQSYTHGSTVSTLPTTDPTSDTFQSIIKHAGDRFTRKLLLCVMDFSGAQRSAHAEEYADTIIGITPGFTTLSKEAQAAERRHLVRVAEEAEVGCEFNHAHTIYDTNFRPPTFRRDEPSYSAPRDPIPITLKRKVDDNIDEKRPEKRLKKGKIVDKDTKAERRLRSQTNQRRKLCSGKSLL